ncbi:L-fuculose-phosphate aldolase [Nocardioides zeae]|uniref:L-fuculose-phosphate aldolase n=1 Tax=Nocardioides zeae TaxID=1457234 RepID=A0ACC6IEE0_9ACTN|nr:class II aldolase/adducin family protein [Nocardioides zeae]MDR6174185.1 L-fuculose-phosphate aldolase [Nocardioides zeae]MDR6208992.1 L-fuculose-phosphate aldolase [Nocardioides zeae]
MILQQERQAVADAGRRMITDGLVLGTAGNVSIRVGDLVAISPSTVAYSDVTAADVCVVDMDGVVVDVAEGRRPSSEVPMHLSIYRESDAASVVHHHGLKSAAVSTLVDVVPTIHYYVAQLGGSLRVAPYARYGSDALAAGVMAALQDRVAALMQNHGAVAHGPTLELAYGRAQLVEWLCAMYIEAASIGSPRELTDADMQDVVAARTARTYA